jgi:two-component system NarL family sensor kinase
MAAPPKRATLSRPRGDAPATAPEEVLRVLARPGAERRRPERYRLARRLHDETAQLLSAAGLQLDLLRMDFETSVPEIARRTSDIQELLDQAVRQIRDLSYELAPEITGRGNLEAALELVAGFYRRFFDGNLRLSYNGAGSIAPATAAAMERIAAEAVSNAVKHAGCGEIEIAVKARRGRTALTVRDNGRGFDTERARRVKRKLGLSEMEYWAANVGLELTIDGGAGRGATITAIAPHSSA